MTTPRKRSCGKVKFLHLSVSHSVHRGWRESLYDATSCLAPLSYFSSNVGICLWSHVPSRGGVSVFGPLFLLGVSVQGSLPHRDRDPGLEFYCTVRHFPLVVRVALRDVNVFEILNQ